MDLTHAVWLGTGVVAVGLAGSLLLSSAARRWTLDNRFFRAFFGTRPERVYWLIAFYLATAAFAVVLVLAAPRS
jgi:hypothetical protein